MKNIFKKLKKIKNYYCIYLLSYTFSKQYWLQVTLIYSYFKLSWFKKWFYFGQCFNFSE